MGLRLLHTADWHLGRVLCGVHLTEDQAHLLSQLVDLVAECKAEAVLIAGDVFDRAVPPPDAVELLGEVLERMTNGLGVPVVLIAGNHDSPQRLAFCSGVLAAQGLHVVGKLSWRPARITLHDEHGPLHVYALPYAEPALARQVFAENELRDHDAVIRHATERARASLKPGERSVLLAHAFVRGSQQSESERPLSLGGAGEVDVAHLAGFDYVALGHLHRPQRVCDERVQYAGSLMKYSFSEAEQPKSVQLVEMDASGRCRLERIALSPRRDLRRLRGTLEAVLRAAESDAEREDYVQVELDDGVGLLNPMRRIREKYPNALGLVLPERSADASTTADPNRHKLGVEQLFAAFYRDQTGRALSAEQAEAFARVVERVRRREREG